MRDWAEQVLATATEERGRGMTCLNQAEVQGRKPGEKVSNAENLGDLQLL
jgi:hypothetical protein